MDKVNFKLWRKQMGFTQNDAALALGMSRSAIEQYEMGRRKNNPRIPVEIPHTVALACAAITAGLKPYGDE